MARRLAEGRTPKMIIRCLKRHVVREVYRAITTDLGLHQRTPTSHHESLLDIQRSGLKPSGDLLAAPQVGLAGGSAHSLDPV